jgi:hypothetical protein
MTSQTPAKTSDSPCTSQGPFTKWTIPWYQVSLVEFEKIICWIYCVNGGLLLKYHGISMS